MLVNIGFEKAKKKKDEVVFDKGPAPSFAVPALPIKKESDHV